MKFEPPAPHSIKIAASWPYGDIPEPPPCPTCGDAGIEWDSSSFYPDDFVGDVYGECKLCRTQIREDSRGRFEWLD